MTVKKINTKTLDNEERWARAIRPTMKDTLRNLSELQRSEGDKQAQAWLKDEYYDIEDDEDASTGRSD